MRTVSSRLALLLALAAPAGALALDAPHDASFYSTAIGCRNCHQPHNAPGAALTTQSGNKNLCDSCHNSYSDFGFPWPNSGASNDIQAVPGTKGKSHRWDATATNLGATAPAAGTPMGQRLVGGKLQCSTCHDQHNGASTNGGSQHTSIAPGGTVARTAGTGTGTLAFTSAPATAAAAGYTIRVGSTATTFQISHDKGTTWLGYSGTTWATTNATGKAFTSGTAVTLDDGLTTVTFTGTFVVGDTFTPFFVSYPFLRVSNSGGAMCTTCHQDRAMKYQDVEGGVANGVAGGNLTSVTLGTQVFHHPTGQGLNTKNGIDNATPLDANGVVQGAAGNDGIKSNDLVLDAGSVTCLSCHHPHNADSNSLTEDPR